MEQPVARYRKYAIPISRNDLALMFFPKLMLIWNVPLKALKAVANRKG
jgi:hypothetical protein